MKSCDSFDFQLLIMRTNSCLSVGTMRPLSSNDYDMVLGANPPFIILSSMGEYHSTPLIQNRKNWFSGDEINWTGLLATFQVDDAAWWQNPLLLV